MKKAPPSKPTVATRDRFTALYETGKYIAYYWNYSAKVWRTSGRSGFHNYDIPIKFIRKVEGVSIEPQISN